MRCQHCSYPVFQYTRCCPNCGVVVACNSPKHLHAPQTRIGFLLVHLRRAVASIVPASPVMMVRGHHKDV